LKIEYKRKIFKQLSRTAINTVLIDPVNNRTMGTRSKAGAGGYGR
jgi:hypothetical protein